MEGVQNKWVVEVEASEKEFKHFRITLTVERCIFNVVRGARPSEWTSEARTEF